MKNSFIYFELAERMPVKNISIPTIPDSKTIVDTGLSCIDGCDIEGFIVEFCTRCNYTG